jgi:mTERF domain-containing protein
VKVITWFPQVLGLSVEDNVAPKVRYLEEEVGLGRAGAVEVITRHPKVLSLSVEDNIAPKVQFLAEEVGAGREGAADIILQQPTMLSLSIERKLRPTLRFALEHFPDANAADIIPNIATHSLAGRLVPRMRLLRKHGEAGRFAASTMAKLTPAEFCARVGVTEEEYDAEVAECVREHAEKHSIPEGNGLGGGGGGGDVIGGGSGNLGG